MNRPFILSITLLCLLLPSCVQWNIGQRIREGGEIHTGVDTLHPVDGKLYRTEQVGRSYTAYVRAPEVTYHFRSPLFSSTHESLKAPRKVVDVRRTGQTRTAVVLCYPTDYLNRKSDSRTFLKPADGIPAGARPMAAGIANERQKESPHSYGSISSVTPCGWGRKLAAAPFDYVIDPVLGATHTAIAVPVALVTTPFYLLWKAASGEP